jgi:hypothetical protein
VIIPGVGHFLQIEAPDAVNEEIAKLVERVAGAQSEAPAPKRAPC